MAARDDDCNLSRRRKLNVVHCLPSWITSNRCVDLAYKPRSEKADAEADKKAVLSAQEDGLCCISRSILPTNDACFLLEVKIAAIARQPKAGLPHPRHL